MARQVTAQIRLGEKDGAKAITPSSVRVKVETD